MKLPSRHRLILAGLLVSLCGLILGVRWAVVEKFGTDLPFWDQWDAEGWLLLAPWFQHSFSLGTLFVPQNEHRVVLTKVLNLLLTLANGQWDQRLEMMVNALLPAAIAAGWLIFAARLLPRRWLAPIWLVIAAAYAAPLSWQNTINGFNSQQFFLVGLSFGAIAALVGKPPYTRVWWLGAGCSVLALGSMATGFFAALVAALVLLFRRIRRDASATALGPIVVLGGVLTVIGWLAKAPQPGHEVLKAHTVGDFCLSLLRSLEWPVVNRAKPAVVPAWVAIPLWLPWFWLALRTAAGSLARPRRTDDWVLTALGGWVLLQAIATAYARGAGAEPPASRYVDTLTFGAVVNALAAARLLRDSRGNARRLAWAAAGAWILTFGLGFRLELARNLSLELPAVRVSFVTYERSVRNYLATEDESNLQPGEIPYPSTDILIDRLNIAELRALLPVSVRPPLALAEAAGSSGFVEAQTGPDPAAHPGSASPGLSPRTPPLEYRRTWGSFGPSGPVRGVWTSQPLTAKPGWLAIETAGQPDADGVSLELRDPTDQEILGTVRPSHEPGDSWRLSYVPAPRGPFVIRAEVNRPGLWLAFGEPVEMAPWSHRAWEIVRQGRLLAIIAGAMGLVFLLALLASPPERGPA